MNNKIICRLGYDDRTQRCRMRKKNKLYPGENDKVAMEIANYLPITIPRTVNAAVWYFVDLLHPGFITADTLLSDRNLNTKIVIYDLGLGLVAVNDDGDTGRSYLSKVTTVGLPPGKYYVLVGLTGEWTFLQDLKIKSDNPSSLNGIKLNVVVDDNPRSIIPTLLSSGIGSYDYVITHSNFLPYVQATSLVNLNQNWQPNDQYSGWIGLDGPLSFDGNIISVKTSFDLTDFLPETVRIVLDIAVDNVMTNLLVNGVGLNFTTSSVDVGQWNSFQITSGFQSGTNELQFLFRQLGEPGIRIRVVSATGIFNS